MDATCPMMIKGCSTGMPPIQVSTSMSATRVQNKNCVRGRNVSPRCLEVCRVGTRNNTRIEANKARTPPSLFGIDRKMAYANKKYHSGLMCGGVTRGFAGVKLSGSPRRFGVNRAMDVKAVSITAKPSKSLYEKYGWKGILSAFEFRPVGLFDPVSCRKRR